jgi:hypothetical protein
MKKFRLINFYTYFLVISCLLLPLYVQSTNRHEAYISREELREVLDNADVKYIYMGTEFSRLYHTISRINSLEDDQNSLLYELQRHIEDGFSIGLYPAVIQALDYAQKTLEINSPKLDPEEAEGIAQDLEVVINQVVNDMLTIDTKQLSPSSIYVDMDSKDMTTRCGFSDGCPSLKCCPNTCKVIKVREPLDAFDKARFKKNVQIDGKLKVYGKAVFKNDVCFEDDVKFKDDVVFKEDVLIEGNLTVDGAVTFNGPIEGLTIVDVIIEELSATDVFIENLSVVDLVVLSCMDNLCVNTLSVTDGFVQNLSVTNATIDDLTVDNLTVTNCMASLCVEDFSAVDASISGTLSVNDAVIDNLSIIDIVVIGCIADLCVENLSVVDGSVSGTLSVTDEFVQNLSVTSATIDDLTVDNLTVTNCIASLCVEDLSAVDVSISGTLSANDAVIDSLSVTDLVVISCVDNLCVDVLSVADIVADSLSLCDLFVSCDIFMNNSSSPAIGNIMKAGNRFIHNFGTDNTFVGVNSGNFTMGGAENVGVGRNALFSNATGFNNVGIGSFAMTTNTIGTNNDGIGAYALVNNTEGNDNAAFGNYTLATNTTGSGNTAVGFQAGYSLGIGNNNVFVGNNAALNLGNGFTNVIIGYNSGLSLTQGDDNIYISNPGVATETGIIRVGTPATHTAAFVQGIFGTAVAGTGIGVFVDANGQLGTVVSSERFKHDIQDMSMASEDIYKLRPVTFVYNDDESETIQYGLIAEQVDEVFPALVVKDDEGKPYTVRYHLLAQLLLNELQKLNSTVQEQAISISELKKDNKKLNKVMHKVLRHLSDAYVE